MAAHHVKHAMSCPAKGNQRLADCTCGAPGAERAQKEAPTVKIAMNPGDLVNQIEDLGKTTPVPRGRPRVPEQRNYLTPQQQRQLRDVWMGIVGAVPDPAAPIGGTETDQQRLDRIGDQVSSMAGGRLISLSRATGHAGEAEKQPILVSQTCPACRELYRGTAVPEQDNDFATAAAVGIAARRARLVHRCAPIAAQRFTLDLLSPQELERLRDELERDGTAMVERSQEIYRIALERLEAERADKKGS